MAFLVFILSRFSKNEIRNTSEMKRNNTLEKTKIHPLKSIFFPSFYNTLA